MTDNRTDRPYWCEICARKKECYGITLKPKCFVPLADRKTEPFAKDINVRSKTEPQTCNDCDQQRCETCVTEIGKDEPQTCSTCRFDHKNWFEPECDSCCDSNSNWQPKDEPKTETEIAKAIVHKMIDDAVIAEDAYPDLRQKMHDAVDEYEPQRYRPKYRWPARVIRKTEQQEQIVKELADACADYVTYEDLITGQAEAKGYADGFKDGLKAKDEPQTDCKDCRDGDCWGCPLVKQTERSE